MDTPKSLKSLIIEIQTALSEGTDEVPIHCNVIRATILADFLERELVRLKEENESVKNELAEQRKFFTKTIRDMAKAFSHGKSHKHSKN
jgi:hypothetical protein